MTDRMDKGFVVCHVTRDDVAKALEDDGVREAEALKKARALSDFEMEHLASKMNDAFCETGVYWDAIRSYMENKEGA